MLSFKKLKLVNKIMATFFLYNLLLFLGLQFIVFVVVPMFIEVKDLSTLVKTIPMIFLLMVLLGTISYPFIRVVLNKSIISRVKEITVASQDMAEGKLSINIQLNGEDELAELQRAFLQMTENTVLKTNIIKDIANGSMDHLQLSFGASDELGQSIVQLVDTLKRYEEDINYTSSAILNGKLDEKIECMKYNGVFKNIMNNMNNALDNILKIIQDLPNPFFILDKNANFIYVNNAALKVASLRKEDIIGKNLSILFSNAERTKLALNNCKQVMSTGMGLNDMVQFNDTRGNVYHFNANIIPLQLPNGQIVGVYELLVDQTTIFNQQNKLKKEREFTDLAVGKLVGNLELLAKGKFNLNFERLAYDEEIKEIYTAFETINKNLESSIKLIKFYVNHLSTTLNEMAEGNLAIELKTEYLGDFREIKEAIETIVNSLGDVTDSILATSNQIEESAVQISDSAQKLSAGVTEEAAAIDEITVTLSNVAQQVKDNADKVQNMSVLVSESKSSALVVDNQMQKMTSSMEQIDDAASKIQKVLKMINDIAFQTNILSLNAAVEAARAGQYGKGFAVIAEDVRNLALKSSDAADETDEMIHEIIKRIKEGKEIANQTAESLLEILDSSSKMDKLSKQINHATNEQSVAVSQITTSIEQIGEVVHATSSAAQIEAMASRQLESQSSNLMNVVSRFKTKKSNQTKKPVAVGAFNEKFKSESPKQNVVIRLDDDFDMF